jgi:hypothetical protein
VGPENEQPGEQGRPPSTPPKAEVVLTLGITVGLGVAALPIDWSWPIRVVCAVVAFVIIIQLFVRVPGLSEALVRFLVSRITAVVGLLVVVSVVIVITHPTFHVSSSVVRVFVAGLTATVTSSLLVAYQMAVRSYGGPTNEVLLTIQRVISLLFVSVVIYGLFAAVAFIALRNPHGPVRDTIVGAIFVGIVTPPLLSEFVRAGVRIAPGSVD